MLQVKRPAQPQPPLIVRIIADTCSYAVLGMALFCVGFLALALLGILR